MIRKVRVVKKREEPKAANRCCDDLCCQELLMSAADGTLCSDHSLERTLDHLERAQ